ncbi:uncharacterized protein LOC133804882 [Humulus lupulus]|uniref:uncharacterized protein LOC133804882 n=1 Tax=Humulus lupulus TaxID=3486 RepID=UPI002B408B0F|nr:uncharacterized protein LOC133804882 [Humulus lupulus]
MPRKKEYLHIWKYGEGHMPGILRGIDTSCAKKYYDWKYDIKEHLTINGPQNRYGGCTDMQWQKAIEFFRRPEITKHSVVNKENRKKLKELSYGGSQSIPALRYKKRNLETEQLEPIPDSWMDTHHKSGTGWVTETAKNTWEELRAYCDTQQTQTTDTESSTPVSSAPEDEDISLVQTVFGKRRGHQKGYGHILNIRDRTPFDFRPSQTRDEEMSEMRERLRQLEEHVRTHCITPGSQCAPPPPNDPDVGAPTQ